MWKTSFPGKGTQMEREAEAVKKEEFASEGNHSRYCNSTGESSGGSFGLKNGHAEYFHSKTSPEHVTVNFIAKESGVEDGGEIDPEGEDNSNRELYLDTVCTKPENCHFFCPKCEACIDKVLIHEMKPTCPTCFECVKIIACLTIMSHLGRRMCIAKSYNVGNPKKYCLWWFESITSLSVVISAASSAAATTNIVALALANLIGGLFVIGHNLLELKNRQPGETSDKKGEKEDQYEEVLGQRKNFILHASVAVLSFLVFGLVPPIVYGFSFYESDNKPLKIAAVAAASFVCITLLAIAKASFQKPNLYKYVTTVLHYLAIGIGASGISYLAGYLVDMLIDKLGLFESSVAVTLPPPEMSSVKHGWGSY